MKPLDVGGRRVHQVGLPYHWGPKGIARGDVVNDLVALSEEPNVRIMEAKALVCGLAAGRRPRGADLLRQLGDAGRLDDEVAGGDNPERSSAS
jgi:formate dehydrogenase major subunit